ncbi:MAG: hypothetical protein NZ901_10140 [Geminocystis sp.]|nr:hypothetical protein [Geminocystis sp.]MCS7148534.1 hypothetical protein [Geminocystis sp.]MCX8079490.1 hypothetical protein [Geminocystis sp.]MDW8114893.1 hypothetical protein [Geminocystis sp.]MDW8464159.1 hypothetical protein [Geminocystis sp.]
MERGLVWSALLLVIVWLTWSGKREYDKLQKYQEWARQFEKSKYDIYAVLGKKGNSLVVGIPTPKGIKEEKTVSLSRIRAVELYWKKQLLSSGQEIPERGEGLLELILEEETIEVPFTDIRIAAQWRDYLNGLLGGG